MGNPFLDPDKEIVQGKTEEDILAGREKRLAASEEERRLSAERIASLGPGDAYSGTIEELAEHLFGGDGARAEVFTIALADIKSHYIGETAQKLRHIYSQIEGCHAGGSNILIEMDELLLPESIRRSAGSGGGFESTVENVIYSGVLDAYAKLSGMEGVAAVSVSGEGSSKEYRILFRN